MQPNNVLSKSMHVRPLAPGEVAIYRLIAADQKSAMATDENNNPINNNPAKSLAKQTLVRDVETGMKVMIGNVVSVRMKKDANGNDKPEEVTGPPKFVRGNVRCVSDEFALYQYMERHDGNSDNPFRDKTKPPVFYRVDPKKKAIVETNRLSMLGEALTWVGNCDHIEVQAINSSLPNEMKIDMNLDYEVIKAKLLALTEKNPIEVMKASNNKKAIVKITVMEAEHYNIIMWDEESRKWFYNDKTQEDILKVTIGTNRIDALVDHFKSSEEGKKLYLRMATKLKKFLNTGSPN